MPSESMSGGADLRLLASSSSTPFSAHIMEVGRMVPARHSHIWRNLPLFIASSFTI
jgi:hypothetical protein